MNESLGRGQARPTARSRTPVSEPRAPKGAARALLLRTGLRCVIATRERRSSSCCAAVARSRAVCARTCAVCARTVAVNSSRCAARRILPTIWSGARVVRRVRDGSGLGRGASAQGHGYGLGLGSGLRLGRRARVRARDAARCGEMRRDVARCGEMRRDAARCGEMRRDVARCGEMRMPARDAISTRARDYAQARAGAPAVPPGPGYRAPRRVPVVGRGAAGAAVDTRARRAERRRGGEVERRGGWRGGEVERRRGGEAERRGGWRGGEVERWRGGEVEARQCSRAAAQRRRRAGVQAGRRGGDAPGRP